MYNLSPAELNRYSRHLLLPEVGMEGQERLKRAKVLVCGAGGLGAPVLLYLAAAGVGTLGVVDYDHVERSNLQRQIIYCDDEVGLSKADRAVSRLEQLNPHISLDRHALHINQDNIEPLVAQYDIIVDGTDNFSTRYLVSDAAALAKKPYIYGSIYRFDGQASVFSPPQGPCYRCLFPTPPAPDAVPNCAEGGVLGVLAGTIGSIQATECLKLILGRGESLAGRLLLYDALAMQFDVLLIDKNPDCPLCGTEPTITRAMETVAACSSSMQELQNSAAEEQSLAPKDLSPAQFESMRTEAVDVRLIDVRNPAEFQLGHLKDAELMTLNELQSHIHKLKKDQTILVYCRSGMRSGQAASILRDCGFLKVYSLAGGLVARGREFTDNPPI